MKVCVSEKYCPIQSGAKGIYCGTAEMRIRSDLKWTDKPNYGRCEKCTVLLLSAMLSSSFVQKMMQKVILKKNMMLKIMLKKEMMLIKT